MAQSPIATASDYADAMTTGRRAKNWLFLLLLVMLLAQIGLFFFARYSNTLDSNAKWIDIIQYVVTGINFLGIVLVIVLGMVLLVLVNIMLAGRLIGLARVTSSFIWCVFLAALLFPWQALLLSPATHSPDTMPMSVDSKTAAALASTPSGEPATNPSNPSVMAAMDKDEFKIPGVLYTWGELRDSHQGAKFGGVGVKPVSTEAPAPITFLVLKWARFVGFPVVALLVLLLVQAKSSRGLRLALGEEDYETAEDQTMPM